MSTAKPTTVKQYLDALPEDRKAPMKAVYAALKKAMPKGFDEGLEYGMISWSVMHEGKPRQYVALASQKSHMAAYLVGAYTSPKVLKTLTDAYAKSGKKLDMGKSCLRFKKLEDVDLKAVSDAVSALSVDTFLALSGARPS
ncbi:MAG: DUF1801 domain-containing protein [Archangium sp.]